MASFYLSLSDSKLGAGLGLRQRKTLTGIFFCSAECGSWLGSSTDKSQRPPFSLPALHVLSTPCLRNSCRKVDTCVGDGARGWQPCSPAILPLGKSPAALGFHRLIRKVMVIMMRFKWGDACNILREKLDTRTYSINISCYYCHS